MIRASWDYQIADVLRATAYQRRRTVRKGAAVLGATLGAVTLALLISVPLRAYPGALAAMGGLTGLLLWATLKRGGAEKAFRDVFEPRGTVELVLTDERFAMRDMLGSSSLAWDVIVHWDETDEDFYVYRDTASYHILPKRIFSDPETITEVRQLLTERVRPGGLGRLDAAQAGGWIPAAAYVGVIGLVFASIVEALAR